MMLPYPENMKTEFSEKSGIPFIPSYIGLDLGLPEFPIGLRGSAMLFAPMPETSVDEYKQIDERDEKIGISRDFRMLDIRKAIIDEIFFENKLGEGVFSPDPGHYPASLLFRNPIHNKDIVAFQWKCQEGAKPMVEHG